MEERARVWLKSVFREVEYDSEAPLPKLSDVSSQLREQFPVGTSFLITRYMYRWLPTRSVHVLQVAFHSITFLSWCPQRFHTLQVNHVEREGKSTYFVPQLGH